MNTNISNKINLLAHNIKILIIGDHDEFLESILSKYFENSEYLQMTQETLDILNTGFFEQFDIVLFLFNKTSFSNYEKNGIEVPINAIYLIDENIYIDFKKYINQVSGLLINPVEEDTLLSKIYGVLSIAQVNNLLKTKEKVSNKYKNDTVNDEIDIFLDQYSGSIMFINDDLNESLTRLQDLELSKDVFNKISTNLIELSNIFKDNKNLEKVSLLLFEFSTFLESIELENIEPTRFSAFDYLTSIVEDLTLYFDELFVYRLFKDVKIFEDSLQSNISYFQVQLMDTQSDSNDDNLEFF